MKKKRINRQRYERKELDEQKKPDVKETTEMEEDFIEHLEFMASLTEGRKIGRGRMKVIYRRMMKKWRQHSLSFWQKWCKLPEQ